MRFHMHFDSLISEMNVLVLLVLYFLDGFIQVLDVRQPFVVHVCDCHVCYQSLKVEVVHHLEPELSSQVLFAHALVNGKQIAVVLNLVVIHAHVYARVIVFEAQPIVFHSHSVNEFEFRMHILLRMISPHMVEAITCKFGC